ncbi:MAG: VCBS repeat-containing protein [Spirochaetes bacterium]|nr:VCBS repeat-containing protein [Spirochaetota bacterium]
MKKAFYSAVVFFILSAAPLIAQQILNDGSFSYRIPITLPPGTNGMGPDLSLLYNSANGNGLLGMGWVLSGLKVITRDPSYPIRFNNEDHYMLDGMKLVMGHDGFYHTEIESYLKIEAYSLNSPSSYWIVRRKDGTTLYFGSRSEAHTSKNCGRIEAVGKDGRARLWALSKVEDPHGNSYIMVYDESSVDVSGDYYPAEIIYTMGNGLTRYRTVTFEYKERRDKERRYFPSFVQQEKLLEWIVVRIDGNLFRKYRLVYDERDPPYRSTLQTLEEYGSDGTMLHPTAFFWTERQNEYQNGILDWHYTSMLARDWRLVQADINGDGMIDLLVSYTDHEGWRTLAAKSNGDGTFEPAVLDWHYTGDLALDWKVIPGDLNGDGKDDLTISYTDCCGWRTISALSRGDGTFSDCGIDWHYTDCLATDWILGSGDIDGDGRTDLIASYTDRQGWRTLGVISSGNGKFEPYRLVWHSSDWLAIDWRFKTADLNGDGMEDLLISYTDHEGWRTFTVLGNGDGSFQGYNLCWHYTSMLANDWAITTANMNGDGSTDLIASYTDKEGWRTLSVLGKGDGTFTGSFLDWHRTDWMEPVWQFSPADINGDRRSDCVIFTTNEDGWESITVMGNGDGTFSSEANPHHYTCMLADDWDVVPVDFDGDGKADLIASYTDHEGWRTINSRVGPGGEDLIYKVTNSMGGRIELRYTKVSCIAGAVDTSQTAYPFVANKSPRYLVTQKLLYDGLGGVLSFSYGYKSGMIFLGKPWERKNLGFRCVRRKNDTTGDRTETEFLQEKPSVSGLIETEAAFDPYGKKLRQVDYEYEVSDYTSSDGAIYTVLETDEYMCDYEEGELAEQFRKQFCEYDYIGNVLKIIDHGQVGDPLDDKCTEFEYVYNMKSNMTKPSKISVYSYDMNDEYSLESEVRYFYDGSESGDYIEKGLVTKKEDENGGGFGVIIRGYDVITRYGYDLCGNKIWEKDGRASSGEYNGYTVQTEYDPVFHTFRIYETNALGQSEEYFYNELMYNTGRSDCNGQLWKTDYDGFGRIISSTSPGEEDLAPTVLTTNTEVQLLEDGTIWKPVCKKTANKEKAGQYLETYEYYDGFGRMIQKKTESGDNGKWVTADFYYDELGRNFKTSVPYHHIDCGYSPRAEQKPCTREEYDTLGRKVRSYNTDGTYKQSIYRGNLVTSIDEEGHVKTREVRGNIRIEKQYNGKYPDIQDHTTVIVKETGNGTRTIDEAGNITESERDKLGRITRHLDPDLGEWFYYYDANGNRTRRLDAKGQTIDYEYDRLNRLVLIRYPSGGNVLYRYDEEGHGCSIGKLTGISYPGGFRSFSYDACGRTILETHTIQGRCRVIETEYDSMGRIEKKKYPDGEILTYEYDDGGTLAAIYTEIDGEDRYYYVKDIRYNPLGKLARISYGNGVSTMYDYYDTEVEFDPSSETNFSYRLRKIDTYPHDIIRLYYEYDRSDNVVLKQNLINYYYTEIYEYDDLSRLDSASSFLYGYNDYIYDDINNVLVMEGRNFAYSDQRPHAVIYDGIFSYSYDLNGNMVSRSDGTMYEYDFENRLVATSDGRAYSYDDSRNRILKMEEGLLTLYFFPQYEEEYRLAEETCNRVKYYYANGERIARYSDREGLLFFHCDHLGSSMRITDGKGELRGVFKYGPYGTELVRYTIDDILETWIIENELIEGINDFRALSSIEVGFSIIDEKAYVQFTSGERVVLKAGVKIQNGARVSVRINPLLDEPDTDLSIKYLYTGREKDGNGMYYYGARYYEPDLGRFITPDPVNRYAYCYDNPVKYIDPSGNSPIPMPWEPEEEVKASDDTNQERVERENKEDTVEEGVNDVIDFFDTLKEYGFSSGFDLYEWGIKLGLLGVSTGAKIEESMKIYGSIQVLLLSVEVGVEIPNGEIYNDVNMAVKGQIGPAYVNWNLENFTKSLWSNIEYVREEDWSKW